jgi:hypothetical protein
MKKIYLLLSVFLIGTASIAQNLKPVAQKVADAISDNRKFQDANLFTVSNGKIQSSPEIQKIVSDATVLKFNMTGAATLVASRPSEISLNIPLNNGGIVELLLVKAEIFTPDFSVVSSGANGQPVSYNGGVHYWGIIKGDQQSIAAISIFNDEVMGMISSPSTGNMVLGKIDHNTNADHIIYNDKNLHATPAMNCFTQADNTGYTSKDLQNANKLPVNCIRIYWEVNVDVYNNKGSITATANYVTGLFSQSAIIYANDAIPVELSEVFIWNTASPYTSTTTSGLLGQFQTFRNSMNGDLGNLLGYAGGGGIAAGFSGICAANLDNSQCYSGIQSTYSNLPTYSWSVEVVTHEQGHLMGSRHTHACVWNGNNTAIDNCGPTAGYAYEGSCTNAPTPVGGGTIMSYCHLVAAGINFSNGFGTQPKNVILNKYNTGACLTACIGTACMPSVNMSTSSVLSTTATFNWAASTGALFYNIRYRIVGAPSWTSDTTSLLVYNASGLTAGNNYEWQVQTVCSGGNSIFTILTTFTTPPVTCNAPTNLSTTSIASASATFNWGAVGGATSYNVRYRIVGSPAWTSGSSAGTSFNAISLSSSSNYEWQVQTVCSGGGTSSFTSSVLFTTAAPPCNGSVNNFTTAITHNTAAFNWGTVAGTLYYNIRYRITGTATWTNVTDTLSPYNATGLTPNSSYEWQIQTVCSQGSSSFSNSVNFMTLCAPVTAAITAGGATTFCDGGNVLLTANSGVGYSYQWFKNGNILPGMISMNFSAFSTGNFTVLITSGACSDTSDPVAVLVNPLPVVVAGNAVGCSGTPVTLNGTPAGGNFSIANPYTGQSTTYTYSYTDLNGCSATSLPAQVTVNPLPVVSFTGLASNYNTSSAAASLSGSPAGGSFSGTGISGNTFDPSLAGAGGPYDITYSYTDGNGCGNSAVQQTTVTSCTVPLQPNAIQQVSGTTKVCPGDSRPYKVAAVSGAISYNWTAPAGAIISAGQGTRFATVDYQGGFTSAGLLSVEAVNGCGSSTPRTKSIARNTPSTPGAITGQSAGVCSQTSVPYSVAAVSGMTYSWSFSTSGATVSSGQGSNSITADFTSGYITGTLNVTAGNGCGTGNAKSLTVKSIPAFPGVISGATGVCANQTGVPYSIAPVPGSASYTWSGPNGTRFSDGAVTSTVASLTTTANAVTVKFGTTSGQIKVKANSSCGSSTQRTLQVNIVCREGMAGTVENLNLYPNPASEAVDISFQAVENRTYEIKLRDILGQVVFYQVLDGTVGDNHFKLHINNLAKGIYALEFNGGTTYYQKLIIQ